MSEKPHQVTWARAFVVSGTFAFAIFLAMLCLALLLSALI